MEVFLRFYFKLLLNDSKIFLHHLRTKNFVPSFLNFTHLEYLVLPTLVFQNQNLKIAHEVVFRELCIISWQHFEYLHMLDPSFDNLIVYHY